MELEPGWNSVFLEIDPVPELADDLFADRPEVEAIWKRGDPTLVAGRQADSARWQTWVPDGDPARFAINLRVIDGGTVYLIKSSSETSLTLTGRPTAKKTKHLPGFNAMGFYVDPEAPSSFEAYLAPSLVHYNTRVFKLQDVPPLNGALVEVTDLSGPIQPTVGYWVKANGAAKYDGPLSIDRGTLRGVDFAKSLLTHTLTLENLSPAPAGVDVNVQYLPSAPPPGGTLASPAGGLCPPPIKWLEYGSGEVSAENPVFVYHELPPGGDAAVWHLEQQGSASARRSFELSVHRQGLDPAWLDADGQGSQYEGVLEVNNGAGFRRFVPVAAQVMGMPAGLRGDPPPGLWVGLVTIREVQWVTAGARIWTNDDPNVPAFEENRRCFGGWKDGQTCTLPEYSEAPDPCVCPECINGWCDEITRRCVGGPNDGETCLNDGDCACPCTPGEDDGTCEYYCVGGDHEGQSCATTAECAAGEGVCSSEATADDDVELLRPTDSEFQFPILVHFGDDGVNHMLTEVTLLWEPGIPYDNGGTPEDPSDDTPEVPGNYVLATPACPGTCCDDLEASSIVSGEPFARRMSTAIFGFDGDLELLQGQNAELETTLDGMTVMPADHRLNPFRHRYHPDHDDPEEEFTDENGNGRWDVGEPFVDANGNETWDEGDSFRVIREFGLAFYLDQPDWLAGAGWGDQLLAGDYTEKVIGICKTDFDSDPNNGPGGITVRGQFQLRRLADVGVLNNGWISEGDCLP